VADLVTSTPTTGEPMSALTELHCLQCRGRWYLEDCGPECPHCKANEGIDLLEIPDGEGADLGQIHSTEYTSLVEEEDDFDLGLDAVDLNYPSSAAAPTDLDLEIEDLFFVARAEINEILWRLQVDIRKVKARPRTRSQDNGGWLRRLVKWIW
jgi:hypothetical protein